MKALLALSVVTAVACSRVDGGDVREVARPVRTTIDSAALDSAFARAAALPRMRSFIVQWRDSVIREEYFHGAGPNRRTNIKSASKSIISALVGVAIAEGAVDSLGQSIGELLPAETRGLDSIKRAITVRDLLSMRSGLEPTSFDNYGSWVTSPNWVRNALGRPMVGEPGGRMLYSTGSSHLLSAIITRATGMSTYEFARTRLARPLGITLRPWQRDPQGIYFGGNDMFLTPRDMLRVGNLYLNHGTHDGRRVLPPEWVDSSWVPRTVSPFNGNRYGYGWWSRAAGGHQINYAWGYGGQFIFVVPDVSLVVVMTSDAQSTRDGGHTRDLHMILERDVIPAFPVLRPTATP